MPRHDTRAYRLDGRLKARRIMDTRTLGQGPLEVSAIGLCCMGMTFSYSPRPDKQDMISLLRAAVDRGVTFLRHGRGGGARPVEGLGEDLGA